MTISPICFDYQFHPVGQGLFASGSLYVSNKPAPVFTWVYDCGTVSEGSLITNAIGRLSKHGAWEGWLDLLIISHFDRDHISGVVELITKFKVGIVLMPYLSITQRLRILVEQNIPATDPSFTFFINPVTFLTERSNRNIREFVFALPTGGDEGVSAVDAPPNEDFDDQRKVSIVERSRLTFRRLAAPEEFRGEADRHISDPDLPQVSSVGPGSALAAVDVWEFVPYNDAEFAPTSVGFETSAQALAAALRDAASTLERENALKALKVLYENEYSRGRKRNIISLFIFCGPIHAQAKDASVVIADLLEAWPYPSRYPCYYRRNEGAAGETNRCSSLYCGDGYLDSPARFSKLQTYMTLSRMSRLGIMQVMHHGAKGNWYAGIALLLKPVFSVFSSDPDRGRKLHPHWLVWDDFKHSNRKQVDKSNGASFAGWLLRK